MDKKIESICGQKRWHLIFSLHCLCSSISHLFTSRLRLVYYSTLKIANDYLFLHPIMNALLSIFIVSLTWLAYFWSQDYLSYTHWLGFFIYSLFLSNEGSTLETLDYTICIGSTSTFLYFDLYLYFAYAAHYVYFAIYIVYGPSPYGVRWWGLVNKKAITKIRKEMRPDRNQ